MSEIKTCEQFVIAELEEARRKIEELEEEVKTRNQAILDVVDRNNVLKSLIKFNRENHRFELSVWKKYDPKEYAELCRIFGVVELEENYVNK